jgi:predicted phage terminase large subunit-like protein
VPPRHLKSICASMMLPAFFLGHRPDGEVMVVSYAQDLASTLADGTRKIMEASRYTELFETRLVARAKTNAMRTTAGGKRRATSIDGVATGMGADLLIFDDAQKAGEAMSDAMRRAANEAFEGTFLSRLNKPDCPIVIIMQRLHEDDFVGHVLGLGDQWDVVNLPAIAEADEEIAYTTWMGEHVFTRKEGEPLHPKRRSLDDLARTRASMGEYAWAAQYQQRPAPAGGGLIREEWLNRYDESQKPKAFERIVQSWDTANGKNEKSDFSVCTTWGVYKKKFYMLHRCRERLNFPDLKRMVVELARTWAADVVLVEDCASGTQLLQDLPGAGFYKLKAVKPEGDKFSRMSNQTGALAAGAVLFPREAPWMDELVRELVTFPNAKHDDQVDSISQALAFMTKPSQADAMLECLRWLNPEQFDEITAKIEREKEEACQDDSPGW